MLLARIFVRCSAKPEHVHASSHQLIRLHRGPLCSAHTPLIHACVREAIQGLCDDSVHSLYELKHNRIRLLRVYSVTEP